MSDSLFLLLCVLGVLITASTVGAVLQYRAARHGAGQHDLLQRAVDLRRRRAAGGHRADDFIELRLQVGHLGGETVGVAGQRQHGLSRDDKVVVAWDNGSAPIIAQLGQTHAGWPHRNRRQQPAAAIAAPPHHKQ